MPVTLTPVYEYVLVNGALTQSPEPIEYEGWVRYRRGVLTGPTVLVLWRAGRASWHVDADGSRAFKSERAARNYINAHFEDAPPVRLPKGNKYA